MSIRGLVNYYVVSPAISLARSFYGCIHADRDLKALQRTEDELEDEGINPLTSDEYKSRSARAFGGPMPQKPRPSAY